VVIPAHNEEKVIESALTAVLGLRWPELDVIVIDDAWQDETRERVLRFVRHRRVRLLHKPVNEGKSMAINDALPACRGELVLAMDADGVPAPDAIDADGAAVPGHLDDRRDTGNPRVLNTQTFLARLQAVEFSATVGIQRRGDAVWGRLMTFSGLCTLFRRDLVLSLGGFAPDMATEDIEMTWRLQLAGREVVYEPGALFGMEVPETLRLLWRQRIRWVRGLAQVLRRHGLEALKPANWRMWPVLSTAALSVVWSHALVLAGLVWGISEPLGAPPPSIAPFLAVFSVFTVIAGIAQAGAGMWLDRHADRPTLRQLPWVAWYPLCYWMLSVVMVVRGTLPGLLRKPKLSVWQIPRTELGAVEEARREPVA
jgi:poly-beta-1,6-N-acetyl-D-glucosamine synthase